MRRYGEELQSIEDFGVLSQQLMDYLRTKHPAAGYAPTLFIHPWSFLRVNFSSKASLQELLRARGIEYDNGLKIDELFELLNAWVFDPTKLFITHQQSQLILKLSSQHKQLRTQRRIVYFRRKLHMKHLPLWLTLLI